MLNAINDIKLQKAGQLETENFSNIEYHEKIYFVGANGFAMQQLAAMQFFSDLSAGWGPKEILLCQQFLKPSPLLILYFELCVKPRFLTL